MAALHIKIKVIEEYQIVLIYRTVSALKFKTCPESHLSLTMKGTKWKILLLAR